MPDQDYYKVMGVSPFASEAEIREKYRVLVKQYHPDQYVGHPLEAEAKAKMQEINEAYAVLSDATKRKEYDAARRGKTTGEGRTTYDSSYGQTCGGPHSGDAYQTGGRQYRAPYQQPYRGNPYYGQSNSGCCSCDTLCALCAADTCCECMGGDLCICC